MTIINISNIRTRLFLGVLFCIFLVFVEFFLRNYYGFCDTVLIREDPKYEYIAIPNQTRFRFRNNVVYNSESMRSDSVDENADIILGFGDSVLNGGVLTDNDDLATSIITKRLSSYFNNKTQFLNISAGSWGPDNSYAYLLKHDNYNCKSIYLFVSSHDAYDNMDFKEIVGVHQSFPTQQYKIAIQELFERYIIPRFISIFNRTQKSEGNWGINKKDNTSVFNSGFNSFMNYSNDNQIPLTIYLHASKMELEEGKYNQQGLEIIQFAIKNNIKVIKDLEHGLQMSDFRDNIHINEQGQKRMSKIVLNQGFNVY